MAKKTLESVLADFRKSWGDRFDYSEVEYLGTNTKVKIICREHGEFWLYPWQHKAQTKKGPAGCYKCGRVAYTKKASKLLRSNTADFIKKAQTKFGNAFTYEQTDYQHSHQLVTVTCSLHGNFSITPGRHLEQGGCPSCGSQHSMAERLWLDSLGIPNDQTTRTVNLRIGGKRCIVDGFDPTTNTVYEFHGDFWHGNPTIYDSNKMNPLVKKTFGQLYQRTLEKEALIRAAGYNLVTIWESDWKVRKQG